MDDVYKPLLPPSRPRLKPPPLNQKQRQWDPTLLYADAGNWVRTQTRVQQLLIRGQLCKATVNIEVLKSCSYKRNDVTVHTPQFNTAQCMADGNGTVIMIIPRKLKSHIIKIQLIYVISCPILNKNQTLHTIGHHYQPTVCRYIRID